MQHLGTCLFCSPTPPEWVDPVRACAFPPFISGGRSSLCGCSRLLRGGIDQQAARRSHSLRLWRRSWFFLILLVARGRWQPNSSLSRVGLSFILLWVFLFLFSLVGFDFYLVPVTESQQLVTNLVSSLIFVSFFWWLLYAPVSTSCRFIVVKLNNIKSF